MSSAAQRDPVESPEAWSRVARGYDAYTRAFLARFSSVALERLNPQAGQRLLDVACGPGTTSLLARDDYNRIDALDFSEEMLDAFRGHLEQTPAPHVHLHHGDGQELPFEDETFDRAVSMFGLMFFPDRFQGMRELLRVLKPGGRVALASWAPPEESPCMKALLSAVEAARPANEPQDRDAPAQVMDRLQDPVRFGDELVDAGFTRVRMEHVVRSYVFATPGEFWDGMVEGALPLVLLRDSLPESEWERRSKIAREHLKSSLAGLHELSSTALLAVAERPS